MRVHRSNSIGLGLAAMALAFTGCSPNFITGGAIQIEQGVRPQEADFAQMDGRIKLLGFVADDKATLGGQGNSTVYGRLQEVAGYRLQVGRSEIRADVMKQEGRNLLVIVTDLNPTDTNLSGLACEKYLSLADELRQTFGDARVHANILSCDRALRADP